MTAKRYLSFYIMAGLLLFPATVSGEEICSQFTSGTPGTLAATLDEISGLALSHTNPDYAWSHTDSGGKAELYLLSRRGVLVQTYAIREAVNTDWEDIAVGPCPGAAEKSCIYIADLGNNTHQRTDQKIYVVEEPALDGAQHALPSPIELVVYREIHVTFEPSGKNDPKFDNPDSESLMVSPAGDIYVLSKQTGGEEQTLYRMEWTDETNGLMKPLASSMFDSSLGLFNAVTAADFAPSGKAFLVRTYANIYQFDMTACSDIAEVFARPSLTMPSGEMQGESAAYSHDGQTIITAAEKPPYFGDSATFTVHTCTPAAPIAAPPRKQLFRYKKADDPKFRSLTSTSQQILWAPEQSTDI